MPDLFDRVSPGVVSVTAVAVSPYRLSDRVSHLVASGFIVDAGGLMLTNAHVAYGRQSLRVTLDDGTILPAQLVGADPLLDLAVLRFAPPAGTALPVMEMGDSDALRVGDDVFAIGNPLGFDQTLTRGIVSAINRIVPDAPVSALEPLIQTDTPINPGNSGGPLLDRCGRVVGINTAVISDAQNIGFAIPINVARRVMPTLIASGHIARPWVGFHGQFAVEPLRNLLRAPLVPGLMVEVVEAGSPADRAGLRGGSLELTVAGREFLLGGDIVTAIDGRRLESDEDLRQALSSIKVGDTIRLAISRDGEDQTIEYVLPERPVLPGDMPGQRNAASRPGPSPPPFRSPGPPAPP